MTAGGGTASYTAPVATNVDGVGVFTDLSVGGPVAGVSQTLSFSFSGIAQPLTSTLALTAGPASQIEITQQPGGSAPAGQPFAIQPIVTIQDQFGNPVTDPATVMALLASGPPTLAGTTTVSTVNGVATFTDLRFDGATGDRTLQFSSGSLTSPPTTGAITVTPGAVASIQTFINGTAAPSHSYGTGLTPFTNATPAPRVLVTDAFGNPVANQAVYWNATTSNGGVLAVGATGTPTGASGTAQVASWLIGDGLNQATAGLFAPNVTPTIPGYVDAMFSASTPTGVSVFACAAPPTSKTDLGPLVIKAPSATMKKVTIRMSITGQSNALSNYDATLEARLNGPTGTLLKSTTGKVQLPGDNGNPVPVTFTFPTSIARQIGNNTIWFMLSVVAPANRKPQVWHSNKTFKSNETCYSALAYAPGSTSVFKRGLSIDVTN